MIDTSNINTLMGATVYDNDGDKIGTVGQVYVDPDNGSAAWLTVKTGLFGTKESFVPATDATLDGDSVRVGYDKAFVKDAPRVDTDGELDQDETDALYDYYGFASTPRVGGQGMGDGTTTARDDFDDTASDGAAYAGTARHASGVGSDADTDTGRAADDAMTRSEEHLRVGTERVETGRARLHKYVVTEQETVTVPVSHEEARVVTEPITDANAAAALDGPDLREDDHEVVLTGDRVVADTEAVPVERVRLDTETVTEQQEVSGRVRKERVDVDGDTTDRADLTDGTDRTDLSDGTGRTDGTTPRI
jgi:uncharacterized protein (TIGR02271 family)